MQPVVVRLRNGLALLPFAVSLKHLLIGVDRETVLFSAPYLSNFEGDRMFYIPDERRQRQCAKRLILTVK
jgi:hypothetical protein